MELKNFIDNAFEKYEDSHELLDFKEELLTNLQDRLEILEKKGMDRANALNEIKIEFADINKIADEMSLAKKKEVFEIKYMSFRHFVTRTRAAIYTVLGILTLLVLMSSPLTYLSADKIDILTGLMIVILAVPLAGFVYMGLTQETAARNPMRSSRASIYAIASFVFLFGLLLVLVLVVSGVKSLETSLVILIPFVVPSIGTLGFLMITENNYHKSWVIKDAEKHLEWATKFEASGNAQTFGVISVGVWVIGISTFVFMLIIKLWLYSWIPLVLATAITMLLLAYFMKKSL